MRLQNILVTDMVLLWFKFQVIRLCLHYLGIKDTEIEIQARTYVSVPNQIILSGNKPKFKDIEWDGMYEIGKTTIIDGNTFHKGMGRGLEDKFMILSFHLKKYSISDGGMILTNGSRF